MAEPSYPPLPEGVEYRWTPSSLQSFLRCSLRFHFDRSPERWTTIPLAIGTGVHLGAKEDAVSKRDTGSALRLPELVECAVTGYETEISEAEIDVGKGRIDRAKDDVVEATLEYGKVISPLVQPETVRLVEEPISMELYIEELEERIVFSGTPDRVEGVGVGDTKTGRVWSPETVRRSRQLTGYGWLMYWQIGTYPQFVFVDNIARRKGKWVAERVTSRRVDQDYDAFYDLLVRATHARRLGVELPAPEGSWHCSEKWCPHWRRCPHGETKDVS